MGRELQLPCPLFEDDPWGSSKTMDDRELLPINLELFRFCFTRIQRRSKGNGKLDKRHSKDAGTVVENSASVDMGYSGLEHDGIGTPVGMVWVWGLGVDR